MIDGAHAPGMLDVSIRTVHADFYTGNCHKWICAPKGAAFLWVEPSFRDDIFPLVTSYGAAIPAPKRSVYHRRFDWTGTHDPTPFICVADAIEFMGALLPGGWDTLRARNHEMVCAAQSAILSKIGETELF